MNASTAAGTAQPRASLRRRVIGVGVALTTTAGLLCVGASGPATADSSGTTPGSAAAQSAAIVAGTGVSFTQKAGSGLLSTLTGPLTTSLLNATTTLPNSVLGIATTALTTTAGLQATNASTRQTRPNPVTNYPVCNQSGWTSPSGNCYSVIQTSATPTLPTGSLLALSAGTIQGYATGDDQGYIAASGSSHPILAVPGLSIDLGVTSSNVQCTIALVCTPTHTFTGGSFTTTTGTQTFALATGTALATIGSTQVANNTTLPIINNLLSVTANGNFLTFNVTLSLTQYLGILGTTLSALNAGLTGFLGDNNSTITLAVTVGPGSLTGASSSSATAWGLEVGVNLVADIKLNLNLLGIGLGGLLGSTELVTSTSNYPSAPGSVPNLLDLRLAYSQGTAGALLPDFVPPGVI